jgi:LacI family transcriptional regulator
MTSFSKLTPRGAQRITVRDVADKSGVSASTVSLVLAKKGNISPDTRQRVLDVAAELGYTSRLRSDSILAMVGILIDDASNPYYSELLDGVRTVLDPLGFLPFVVAHDDDLQRQSVILSTLDRSKPAGLLIIPASGSSVDVLGHVSSLEVPFVVGIRHLGTGEYDYVGPSYFRGVQLAVSHLISLGHKRIALAGGEKHNSAYRDRYSGYVSSLQLSGLSVDENLVLHGPATYKEGEVYAASLMNRSDPPSAIIAYNDFVALGVMHGLETLGFIPGRDVSVIGFDDVQAAARDRIPLTTVSTPPGRLGSELMRLLVGRMSDSGRAAVYLTPPPALVVRKSCGPKPE